MIKGIAAKLSPVIVGITALVFFIIIGLVISGFRDPQQWYGLFIGISIISLITLGCYLRAPVFYEITSDHELIVQFRCGSRSFKQVAEYSVAPERPSFGIRLWGNGGLFAVTGIFWNRKDGKYHGYVTNLKKLVVVKLQNGRKVVISPENAEEWNSGPAKMA